MKDTTRDIELVQGALYGDAVCWDTIILENHDSLQRLVRRGIPVLGYEIEDVMQYFWMVMYSRGSLVKYNGSSPLNYWLRRQLQLVVGELLKKRHKTKYTPLKSYDAMELPIEPPDVISPEDVLLFYEMLEVMYVTDWQMETRKGVSFAKKLQKMYSERPDTAEI